MNKINNTSENNETEKLLKNGKKAKNINIEFETVNGNDKNIAKDNEIKNKFQKEH
mgnify:CR=1 FL=1